MAHADVAQRYRCLVPAVAGGADRLGDEFLPLHRRPPPDFRQTDCRARAPRPQGRSVRPCDRRVRLMAPLDDSGELSKIRDGLNDDAASALQWLFPNGRLIRNEFCVGDINGTEGESLRFNIRKCTGADFNGGAEGFAGVLDVFIAKAGNFPDGLDLPRQFLGVPEPERPQPKQGTVKGRGGDAGSWTQIIPPPADASRPEFTRLWPSATFQRSWEYRDAAGRLLFYV